MSSHLSVSYSPSSQSGVSAPGQGTASTTASQSPLGFLAALIDQITATTPVAGAVSSLATAITSPGTAPRAPTQPGSTPTSTTVAGSLAALLAGVTSPAAATNPKAASPKAASPKAANPTEGTAPAPDGATATASTDPLTGVDSTATAALVAEIKSNPAAAAALSHLAKALGDIGDSLNSGETPAPVALKKLSDAVDAVLALLMPPQAPPALAATPTTATLDPLAAIASTAPRASGNTAPDATIAPAPKDAGSASSGISAQSATGATGPTGASDVALPGIAALAGTLESFSQSLRSAVPGIADKLESLSARLEQAATDPTALAALTNSADTDGTKLDALVKTLLKGVATPATTSTAQAATPAIAAPQGLPLPAVLAPDTKAKSTASPAPTGETAATRAPAAVLAAAPQSVAKQQEPVSSDSGKSADNQAAATAAVPASPAAATPDKSTDTIVAAAVPAQPAAAPMVTTPARLLPAAYQNGATTINMAQIAFEMVHQATKGQSRFTIRLDPADLGRVDVRMHVDNSGTVNAQLTVERTETLDMFQRDKGTLERALSQAGLDSSKTNLEFSLRQNPFAGMSGGDRRQGGQFSGTAQAAPDGGADTLPAVPAVTLYRGVATSGGVNLFA